MKVRVQNERAYFVNKDSIKHKKEHPVMMLFFIIDEIRFFYRTNGAE